MAKKADRVETVKADKPPVPRPLKLNGENADWLLQALCGAERELHMGNNLSAAGILGSIITFVRLRREVEVRHGK